MESQNLYKAKSKLAITVKVSSAVLMILALYYQDLSIISNEALQSEIMSYMLAIPMLFLYLIFRKRKMIRATLSFEEFGVGSDQPASPSQSTGAVLQTRPRAYLEQIVGVLLCLTAFLLYWHGSYTFYPLEYHMVSFPIFISGIVLVMFNWNTLRALAFPIALLFFLTPPPQEVLNALGSVLSVTSSESAYAILKASGLPVSLSAQYGNPVIRLTKPGSPTIPFTIDTACAGFYSLIGFLVFATFIAHVTKARMSRKAALFIIGIPLMFALNTTRIVSIVLIGYVSGREAALQAFHLFGGWVLILAGSLILATASEKFFKIQLFTARQKMMPCNYCNPQPHANAKQHFCISCGRLLKPAFVKLSRQEIGKILVLLVIAVLIVNIQAPVFAITEGPVTLDTRTLGGTQTTTKMLPQVADYTSVFLYRDTTFEDYAKQDASLIYSYYSNDTSRKTIWVVVELAKTRASMHPWEVCLITWQIAHGYQPQVVQLSQRDIHLMENPPVTARFFSFKELRSNYVQVILYWYESAFFNTTSGMEREYTKISFIGFAKTEEDVPSVEAQLLPFGRTMVEHWLPIKSWSLATLLISQNGIALISITVAALAIVMAYYTIKKRKKENLNIIAYTKLVAEEEKLILKAVQLTSEIGESTSSKIALAYQQLSGRPIETKPLDESLRKAEEAGFMKAELGSHDDYPILVWKTRIPILRTSRPRNSLTKILELHPQTKPKNASLNPNKCK